MGLGGLKKKMIPLICICYNNKDQDITTIFLMRFKSDPLTRFGSVLFIIEDERIRFYYNEIDTNNFIKNCWKGVGGLVGVLIFFFSQNLLIKTFLPLMSMGNGYLMNRTSFVHPYMGIFIKVFQ